MKELTLVWWSGLRGAVGLILALEVALEPAVTFLTDEVRCLIDRKWDFLRCRAAFTYVPDRRFLCLCSLQYVCMYVCVCNDIAHDACVSERFIISQLGHCPNLTKTTLPNSSEVDPDCAGHWFIIGSGSLEDVERFQARTFSFHHCFEAGAYFW